MSDRKSSIAHVAFQMVEPPPTLIEETEEGDAKQDGGDEGGGGGGGGEEENCVHHDMGRRVGRQENIKPEELEALNGKTRLTVEEVDEMRDQLPFFKARQSRFSTVSAPGYPGLSSRPSFGGLSSRPSFGGLSSRLSFGGLSSRPSMASLKSTISRVNSELYPERGSFVAFSLGQSLADMPPLARKMYIITQVTTYTSTTFNYVAHEAFPDTAD